MAEYPNDHLGAKHITLDPMWRSPFGANGYMAISLPILLAIAGIVLLLTCANVATLTLVRFVSRRREIAIRQSLGAKRLQLMRQMVLEGVILRLRRCGRPVPDLVDGKGLRPLHSAEFESSGFERECRSVRGHGDHRSGGARRSGVRRPSCVAVVPGASR